MKKVALLIVLMMIFAFVYAEDPVVTVTGAVKAQWGMDLDNSTTGFKYALDGIQAVIKPAVDTVQSKKTGAEGDTAYGEISMAGLRLEADSGWDGMTDYNSAALNLKWDALVAKIVVGDLTIMIKDGASTTINYEGVDAGDNAFWLTNAYDYGIFDLRYGSDDSTKSAASANSWESTNDIQFVTPGSRYNQPMNAGIVVKYALPNLADLALDIASYKAWDDTSRFGTTTENDNAYSGRVTAELKAVPNLTANVGSNFTVGYAAGVANAVALGGRLGYKLALGEDMSITPSVAGDVQMLTEPAVSVTGGVLVELSKSKITVNAGYDMVDNGFALTAAANIGMIENLMLMGAVELIDTDVTVDGGDTMAIHGKLGYGIKVDDKITVTPSVQVSYDNKGDATEVIADDVMEDMYAKVALDVAGLLANTTFSLNWDSNDLSNNTTDVDKLGQLVFTTRISF